jgi:DNA-binding transcriptional MocR family regulator
VNQDLFVPAFANPAGSPIRELFPYLSQPGIISFAGGYPSPGLFDAEGLSAAAQTVFCDAAAALQYGATEGSGPLKEELLKLSARRGIQCGASDMLVTTGSQQAFDLIVRVLVQPGDLVFVETPAYPAALQALRLAGAAIREVPMDAQGLQVGVLREMLERLPANARPKMLYTVPTFSNPRGTLLPSGRRVELLALARKHGFLIVEDDPYGELTFTGETPPSMRQLGAQEPHEHNPVVYLSSLSKTVAPALRIGWMIGAPELVRRCAVAKQTSDLCTSPVAQLIAAHYLRSGRYPATVRTACDEYKRRAQAMSDALRSELGEDLQFDEPSGGLFLWADSAVPVNPKRLFQAAVDEGVLFVPGAAFHPRATDRVSMRLSFAAPDVSQIREGVRRLARAFALSTSSSPAHS